MKNNYLLINELAKLFDVTTHTLRFYEEKGLIEPISRTDKGYRLYDFEAISRLEEILMLRSLNMSIENISTYFNQKGIKKYKHHLENLEKQIDKTILELQSKKQQIHDSSKLLHHYELNKDSFFIKSYPKRYLLYLDDIIDIDLFQLNEKLFFDILINSTKEATIKASKDLVFLSTETSTQLYLLINPIDLPEFNNNKLRILPKGSYLCCFYEPLKEKDYIKLPNKTDTYMKKNALISEEYLVNIYSSDYTVFSHSSRLTLMQTPLK